MTSAIVSVALTLAMGSTGGWFQNFVQPGGRIMPPGPGYGWGFPNGNPDGYGWVDYGTNLPLGADRTSENYFPRYFAIPAEQAFMGAYYNPYATRGQRYLPYSGCGGCHPAGGAPAGLGETPMHPYDETLGSGPRAPVRNFSGRVEAPPITSGGSGLTP